MPILIRAQGGKIKVIRKVKAADTGRFRQRVVGTFVANDPVRVAARVARQERAPGVGGLARRVSQRGRD